jgi:hypothetical protein
MFTYPNDEKGGASWFYGAGAIAILFSIFLYAADEGLSNSKRDQNLGKTLFELRSAQSLVGTEATKDPRTTLSVSRFNSEAAPE